MIRLFLSISPSHLLPFSPVALAVSVARPKGRSCCTCSLPRSGAFHSFSFVLAPSPLPLHSFPPFSFDPPRFLFSLSLSLLPRGEHRIIVKRRKGMREGGVGVACGRARPFHSRGPRNYFAVRAIWKVVVKPSNGKGFARFPRKQSSR